MIIDQLFEDDDKKKKLNEIDPRNYDSDEDYYNDLHGDDDDEDFDGDVTDDEISDMDHDEESYYEKYVRTKNLEEEMPVIGQVTGTTSQTDTPPNRSFGVMIKYTLPGKDGNGAVKVWQALETILPRDYPQVPFQQQSTKEPQARVLADLRNDQFSIVKQNISSQDIAETIASKFEGKGIPAKVIDGGVYEEAMSRKTDAKGRTQQQWIQAVYKQFPDARIVQAKMIDGPAHAMLPDGRKFSWTPVQGVTEAIHIDVDLVRAVFYVAKEIYDGAKAGNDMTDTIVDELGDYFDDVEQSGLPKLKKAYAAMRATADEDPSKQKRAAGDALLRLNTLIRQGMSEAKASTAAFRASNAKRAKLNAMSPEERKEYDKEQAEKQRKRDDARLEKERQKLAAKKGVSESRRLNEAVLMEDPVYRKFKRVGRYIAERKMSEKEILQVFADAEAGMTDKATGANRTFLGRGKDTAMDFAGGVADALKGVWSGIQSSVPVAAVDVAYDQATDALANLTGGQKGAVMQAIKKYRMLAKQYPKTAGLAKGALVAIAGLATGGAAAPAIAAFVYGLDSAVKGDKFSDIALKAGGAAATAWAASKIASAVGGDQAGAGADAGGMGDPSQLPPFDDAGNLAPGFHISPENGQPFYTGDLAPTPTDIAAGYGADSTAGLTTGAEAGAVADTGAAGFGGGTYTTMPGDQGGYIAQANGISFPDLKGLNPQIKDWDNLPIGTELQLPPANTHTGSVWDGSVTGAGPSANVGSAASGAAPQISPADVRPFGSGAPDTSLLSNPSGEVFRTPLGQPGSYGGSVSGVTSDQIMQSPVYQQVYAQQMAKFGSLPNASLNASRVAAMAAKAAMVKESTEFLQSVKMRKVPFDKLVDQKSTVMSWALSESIGVKRKSVYLSAVGTYTVFENVDRCRKAVMELKGVPGSTRPDYYRPDMPDAPAPTKPPKNQSWFGKGLDYLDKGVKKVGGALSNFGHQFTTNVTKEKLKMNWHQAGKPSDSDQLAAWLVKQGVPQEVVTSVYGKMGIPYTAPTTTEPATTEPAATEPKAKTGGAQKTMPFYGTNPATKKPWTYDELQAKSQTAPADTPADTSATTTPTTNPVGFNAGNIFKQPGMEKYAKPAPAKTPNFAQQGGGYGKVTTTIKPMTGIPGMKPTPAPAPTATAPAPVSGPMKIGGQKLNPSNPADKQIIDKVQAQTAKVAEALKRPVAEMLSMVETKEDVAKIKQFVDQTFVKYGAVSESAFVVRNKLIEHITQVGAQRRREYARKS